MKNAPKRLKWRQTSKFGVPGPIENRYNKTKKKMKNRETGGNN